MKRPRDAVMKADTLLGATGCVAALAIFIYYTAWVILAPFVDAEVAWFHALFPARSWAFTIPTILLAVAFAFVVSFIGIVSAKKR